MLIALLILCAGGFIARLFLPTGLTGAGDQWYTILNLRLISAVSALIVGSALAVSGVYLQTLLRNPLASPYILGLAAGAGLGVAASTFITRITTTTETVSAPWSQQGGAAVGALVVLFIVYTLSRRRGLLDPVTILLVGVMVSAVAGAMIMLLQFLSPAADTDSLIRWMMGSISQFTQWHSLITGGIITIAGIIIGLLFSRALDVAVLHDDEAQTIGVNVNRLRTILFITAGLLTAAAVVLAGPIGFVGLVAPHIARSIVGPRHFALIIASALIGAALILFADTGVRFLPRTHGLMPIGIITATLGGPVFIWILRRERNQRT